MQSDPSRVSGTPAFAGSGAAAGRQHNRRAMIELLIFGVAPGVILSYAAAHGLPIGTAILLAAILPVVGVVRDFLVHRRLNWYSVFSLVLIAIGLVTALGTHDARLFFLRHAIIGLIIAALLLGSAFTPWPAIYFLMRHLAATTSPEAGQQFRTRWQAHAGFRQTFYVLTMVWGLLFLIEALVLIYLVYALPSLSALFAVEAIVGYIPIICGVLFSVPYVRYRRRKAALALQAGREW